MVSFRELTGIKSSALINAPPWRVFGLEAGASVERCGLPNARPGTLWGYTVQSCWGAHHELGPVWGQGLSGLADTAPAERKPSAPSGVGSPPFSLSAKED